MKFQNKRGGRIVLKAVDKPERDDWGTPLEAMKMCLALERNVNQVLLDLHAVATLHADNHMTDFLEGEFLEEQVESIKELGGYVTQLTRVGTGLGEYLFDKELEEKK